MHRCIQLKDVSVRYRLPKERIRTFKEFVIQGLHRKMEYEEFWAVKGVSLELNRGDRMGIVGPNGSGKTTLLKVVAGVIKPQEGTVRVDGNVTPLTQLGLGFNGELTGRENIYLNGAVFGLNGKQMNRRFADIVEFAELADFVDSPLRTYSAGMIARLGFATAIHTDPEILLLDEVLAVGDPSFQHKCINRIERFKRERVTILFVSHDMRQVREVCDQALWLNRGHAMAWGDSESVVTRYENHIASGDIV